MSGHRQEPWAVIRHDTVCAIHIVGATPAARPIAILFEGPDDAARDDARRLVACVNACTGLRTEDLEDPLLMPFVAGKYQRERDALLEGIRNLHQVKGRHHSEIAVRRLFAVAGLTPPEDAPA